MQTVERVQPPMNHLPFINDLVHAVDNGRERAVTHAIVIGIGTYPWGRTISDTCKLADLKSPARSAVAIADWLIKYYHHPARPLASVALVVSDGESFTYRNPITFEEHVVPCGTAADLQRCVAKWAERSIANVENGTIFYFCGHGISSGHRNCILSRSFGEDPYQHLAGAFEQASVINAMRLLGPRHQLFFFDACRRESPDLLADGANATSLLSLRPGTPALVTVERCTLYSTAEGADAFGDEDGISYFAAELLKACESAAERQKGWWIRTHLILRHMKKFLKGQSCQLDGEDVEVHCLLMPPLVPVMVSCDPTEHISGAQLEIHSAGGQPALFDGMAELQADCWRLSLTSGSYKISATACVLDGFIPFTCPEFIVYPPFADIILDMANGNILP